VSTHSYSRCWLHLIWKTLRREPMLDKRAAARASASLSEYSHEKGIYMKINYFNADHTPALIDLPTNLSIEQVIQLLKGSSSHWMNQNHLVKGRFAWGRATELSRSRSRTLAKLPTTLLGRKNITGREVLRRSMRSSLSGTAWNGVTRKTVETVWRIQ
jgi:REP element-mobilizing transposase RayT